MNESSADDRQLLKTLRDRKARAMHVAEICGRLGIPKRERQQVHLQLERLAEEGKVSELPGGRFRIRKRSTRIGDEHAAPTAHQPRRKGDVERTTGRQRKTERGKRGVPRGMRTGRITLNPRGFGFVITEEEGPDVFIPPPKIGGALHNDRVRIYARPSRQGMEGEVVEVLERGSRHFGGIVRAAGKHVWVESDDGRMRSPALLSEKLPTDVNAGDAVICEITRFPDTLEEGVEARVVEVMDAKRIAEFEVQKTKLREGVVEEFPPEVVKEASAIPKSVRPSEKRNREDLRHIDLVTIDPEDARDHDDAVWAEKKKGGGYRVIVAIADVSHYVREGTAMDAEAIARGCTIYIPDRAIPMLPAELSSNLASLVANRDRLTLAVEVELGPAGAIKRHRYIEGIMRSRAFLTYDGVARALGLSDVPAKQKGAEARKPALQTLKEIADILRKRRSRRGALHFDLPEAHVRVHDETGHPVEVFRARKDPGISEAYNIIEEMMLLANEVVATDLSARELPAIYRVHPPPDENKLEIFAEVARRIGYDVDRETLENPKELSRFLEDVAGTPHAQTLSYLLLRAMQQATYDTQNIGHFGLAAKHYVHFTSPIRRYPDLAVHRIIRKLARGERIKDPEALVETLRHQAAESSRFERRAMKVEREVMDLYSALLMRDRVGEQLDGTITGIAQHAFFVTLDDPFVTVACRVEDLGDLYEVDEHGLRLTGTRTGTLFELGQRLTVELVDISITRRQIYGVPLATALAPAKPAGKARRRSKGKRKDEPAPQRRERSRGSRRGGTRSLQTSASRRGTTAKKKGKGNPDRRSDPKRRKRK